MWWKSSVILFLLAVFSCEASRNKITVQSEIAQDAAVQSKTTDSLGTYMSISFPKNSGLAFVDYRVYTFKNDTLFKFDQTQKISSEDEFTQQFSYDTLAVYPLDTSKTRILKELIVQTDSLGDHHANGCFFIMGWPRFFIDTYSNGKVMEGFVTNCYREHIYRFVDFMNDCHPEGKVLDYSKEELILTEKHCNENETPGKN